MKDKYLIVYLGVCMMLSPTTEIDLKNKKEVCTYRYDLNLAKPC